MVPRLILINGPNLNLVGTRKTEVYGSTSWQEYLLDLRQKYSDVQIEYFQSNHEGKLIDWLHAFGHHVDGIILNAGGYSHTSIAIRDAIEAIEIPVVNVHISNIYEREEFRRVDLLKDVCAQNYVGHGLEGYEKAVLYLIHQLGFEAECENNGTQ